MRVPAQTLQRMLLALKRCGVFALVLFLVSPSLTKAEGEDKLDFKYMYYADKNEVWNHTPAFSFFKSFSHYWRFQWDQEVDAVSGASRRLGWRNVGRQGDHDLIIDGMSGASKVEIRHSEQASLGFSDKGRQGSASFYFSDESDYTSYSPAVAGSWDFNERNTTLGGVLSFFFDNLHPQGAFAGLGGNRQLISSTLSLSQILSRSTLWSITANTIRSSGALGHPYNPVILADGSMLIESLPEKKVSYALSSQIIQGFQLSERRGSVHFDARYYRDSWQLASQTAELQLYQYLSEEIYCRLRTRLYHQGSAAFSKQVYLGNEVYRTSDIRYFAFSTISLGAKLAGYFPEGWAGTALLPDRWDISYDHGLRNTRGEEGGTEPFRHTQTFPRDEYYRQHVFMAGLGFDL